MALKEISKIDAMSFANMAAVIYGLFGMIMFLFIMLRAMLAEKTIAAIISGIFYLGFYAILFVIIGGIIGAIHAFLYNEVASRIGGVKIELK